MTIRRNNKNGSLPKKSSGYVVGPINNQVILANKRRMDAYIKYHWNDYSELAYQRSLVFDKLIQALNQTAISYNFDHWQRAMPYKYSLTPLSTLGSLNFIGGRFNIGKDLNNAIPSFAGLYIAENKDTALQEHLG